MAHACRTFTEKSNHMELKIFCLHTAYEIDLLLAVNDIDILVAPVFCYGSLVEKMPKIFVSERIRFVWFDQVDEMSQTNGPELNRIFDEFLSQEIDIQVRFGKISYKQIYSFSGIFCFIKWWILSCWCVKINILYRLWWLHKNTVQFWSKVLTEWNCQCFWLESQHLWKLLCSPIVISKPNSSTRIPKSRI